MPSDKENEVPPLERRPTEREGNATYRRRRT